MGSTIEIEHARDEQHARIQALDGLVTALRYEAHEYANRLHVLSTLLWMEDIDAARNFVSELTALHHTGPVADLSKIANPVVAGVLASTMSAAKARAVTLVLDERSRLDALPAGLSDAAAVTLFANLLDNAIDAATEMTGVRRRVKVAIEQRHEGVVVEVRDWGRGLKDAAPCALAAAGRTTKPGHYGLGLSLVRGVVDAAGGSFALKQRRYGVLARVWLPTMNAQQPRKG